MDGSLNTDGIIDESNMIYLFWIVVKNVNMLHKEDIFTFSYSC